MIQFNQYLIQLIWTIWFDWLIWFDLIWSIDWMIQLVLWLKQSLPINGIKQLSNISDDSNVRWKVKKAHVIKTVAFETITNMLGKSSPKIEKERHLIREISQKRDIPKGRCLKHEISQKRDIPKGRSLKRDIPKVRSLKRELSQNEISQKGDLLKGRSPNFRDSPVASWKLGMQACKQASISNKFNKTTPLFNPPYFYVTRANSASSL